MIMTVKNGMPYLSHALESVAQQNFSDFELVIQDGESTDGSLEMFQRYCLDPRLNKNAILVSESDQSLADAKLRAMKRCRGEIIGSIDADNLLELDCLSLVADFFKANPSIAALYGAQRMIDERGTEVSRFTPAQFDVLNVLECELVPPFGASFFRSSLVGDKIHPAPDLLYCADFELWLNIAELQVHRTDRVLGASRISSNSITCRPQSYEQMCLDKITAIERYFGRLPDLCVLKSLRQHCIAGVYCWAAESVKFHFPTPNEEENQLYFLKFLKAALEVHPNSTRALELVKRAGLG